jgi:predicted Rossmann fold nucleotide-binding protein DprA/Smf involved in DNA uptake
MNTLHIYQGDPGYPLALQNYLGDHTPATLTALGNLDLLTGKMLALFCSVKCPGKLILQTYDLAQNLRQADITVIGGFHSPMERECLTILLHSSNPIIICPARGIENMRLRAEYKQPLADGRLLILSPFVEKPSRPTVQTALYRNRVVAALAERIFVAYAKPSGKTEQFCQEILAWGKRLYTLESDLNANLITLGMKPLRPHDVDALRGISSSD